MMKKKYTEFLWNDISLEGLKEEFCLYRESFHIPQNVVLNCNHCECPDQGEFFYSKDTRSVYCEECFCVYVSDNYNISCLNYEMIVETHGKEVGAWVRTQFEILTKDTYYEDNFRVACVGFEYEEKLYLVALKKGCCGYCDVERLHKKSGKTFKLGFNWGH